MSTSPRPFEIQPEELAALLNDQPDSIRLIDCRQEDEYAICRIDDAELMPLPQFPETVQRLDDKTQHLVVYCHHGMRSARATEYLRAIGYSETQSLAGGIDRWSIEIDPNISRY